MEGTFKGVKTHPDVKEPQFIIVGRYNTVRYGWLDYFALYAPVGSIVKRISRGDTTYFVVETEAGRYGFKVVHGNAYYPAVGRVLDEEEIKKILSEQKIIDEAKAVF